MFWQNRFRIKIGLETRSSLQENGPILTYIQIENILVYILDGIYIKKTCYVLKVKALPSGLLRFGLKLYLQ